MARINLLPWRAELRKQRQREFGFMALVFVLLTAAGMGWWHFYNDGLIKHQTDRNQFMRKEIARLEEQIKEIAKLEETRQRLIDRMNVIQNLQISRPQIVHLFDEIVETLPTGVYLTELSQTGSTVSLIGRAQSNARVSSLMRSIEKSQWIGAPQLKVIENKDKTDTGLSHFGLSIKQRAPGKESEQ